MESKHLFEIRKLVKCGIVYFRKFMNQSNILPCDLSGRNFSSKGANTLKRLKTVKFISKPKITQFVPNGLNNK